MSNIYYKICVNCSENLSPSDRQCPKCGQNELRMEFREPVTVSGGPGTVEFPVFCDNPRKTKVTTTGDINVSFASSRKAYTFSKINERRKSQTHFIHIRTMQNQRDGNYLDIIFGRTGKSHSHIGYKAFPATLFHENRIGSDTKGEFSFDKDDGGFIPLQKIIRDVNTDVKVCIKFILNLNVGEIGLEDIEFK